MEHNFIVITSDNQIIAINTKQYVNWLLARLNKAMGIKL